MLYHSHSFSLCKLLSHALTFFSKPFESKLQIFLYLFSENIFLDNNSRIDTDVSMFIAKIVCALILVQRAIKHYMLNSVVMSPLIILTLFFTFFKKKKINNVDDLFGRMCLSLGLCYISSVFSSCIF